MTVKNTSDSLFFRQDMPGHIKHKNGDTFSEGYKGHSGLSADGKGWRLTKAAE